MPNKKTHVPGAPPRPLAKAERRQWIRYAAAMEVSIRPLGMKDDRSFTGELRDVSFVGAGLVCETPVQKGALLEVRPLYRTWSAVGRLMMRVRTVKESSGVHTLGCTFVRQLTEEELQGML
jgi:hypothetical protein